MTLIQLGQLILRVLGVTQTVEALVNGLTLAFNGWKTQFDQLVAPITGTYAIVNDVHHGNVAIKAAIDSMTGSGSYDLNAILAAIAALPAGSSLPPASEIAGSVWAQIDPFSDSEALMYGEEIANAHRWASTMIHAGSVPMKYAPFFNVSYPVAGPDTIPTIVTWPQPDWADIQPTDSLLSWLERTCPDYTWQTDASGEDVNGYLTELSRSEAPIFTPRLTSTEWLRIYGRPPGLPPIWPGIDGVTLGDPVPITGDVEVAGPMDGVLITLTTVPPGLQFWSAGGLTNSKYAGYLAFTSDNGDAEPQTYLAFDHAVYAPRTLTQAASCLIHCHGGIEGTATPWSLPT